MNESYVLGRNKTVFETAEFPQITADEKIGIMFDADIESTLLAIIAEKLYGADRVVFINDQAMGYDGKIYKERKDLARLNIINSTIEEAIKKLGSTQILNVETEIYMANRNATDALAKLLVKKYNNKLRFVLSGWNKIHEQSISMLKSSGWTRGMITNGQLKPWLIKNAAHYPELHKYVFEQYGGIFGVNKNVAFEQYEADFNLCVRPFRNLTTSDVIDLYDQLGAVTQLYQSSSCKIDLGNCGTCDNCHQRKSAFKDSMVIDLTKYTLN